MSAAAPARHASLGTRVGRWAILVVVGGLLAFPFYWMLITSFKQTGDLYDLTHKPPQAYYRLSYP